MAIGNWQFAIIVSFAVVLPTLVWGVPSNLDLTNHFRFAVPFYDAIAAGDFYPGWLAESNHGYGDPSFRFYPPAFYYLLAAARFLIGNWYVATLVVFAVVSITAGLGMYFWTRSFLPSATASWAAVFYALVPYHVNQLYQAAMLAEWAGAAVLPFVFGFVERVCNRGTRRDVAGLAATYALLIFTHLPLAVLGSLALAVYALVRIDGQDKIRKLIKLSSAVILGLSVSALYWVTMMAEKNWIIADGIKAEPSVYDGNNFILSTLSPDNLSVWWLNILALMTLLLCAPAFLLVSKSAGPLRRTIRPVIVVTAFAFFMSIPLSRPIWQILRPLQETQFPWRWMTIVSMGASILAAAALPLVMSSNNKFDRPKRILIFGGIAISIAFTFSHSVREAQYFSPSQFESLVTEVRGTNSINYWLPVWAARTTKPMANEIAVEGRVANVSAWQSEHRKFTVSPGAATEARVRTFYYPHWVAKSDAGILPTRPDTDGVLLVSIPQSATSVELDFREPRRTKFSTISSLGGLIVIGCLAAPFGRRRKQ